MNRIVNSLIMLVCLPGFFISQNTKFPDFGFHPPLNLENISYSEYIQMADNYWEQTPHDFKGSGIKPYLRWRENSKYMLKPDGTLKTANEIAGSWNHLLELRSGNQTYDNNSQWIPIGPFSHENAGSWSSGQGRVNVCTVDPSNPNTIYVGAPDGGAWKSTNGGDSWVSIGDDLPVWGVSGIAVDYNNPDVIYLSTGDEDGFNSYSNGVYKSTDGGGTWMHQNISNDIWITGEIFIHPTNSAILWICTDIGLFKTTNGGITWSLKASGNIKEIRLKPNNPNVLYLVDQHAQGVNILKSTNGGETFSTVKNYPGAGRTVIDVTPANPEVLYVLATNQDGSFKTLDKSSNGGTTFIVQNNSTDILESYQAFFDLAIAVSDVNENKIFTGCLNVWGSDNGGQSFYRISNWDFPNSPQYTHADIHALYVKNGKLYASTDGGIYISNDYGNSFVDKTVNGLNIGQFYRIDVAQNNLSQVVGGLQDNGGYIGHNNQWYNFYGADGMDAAINPTATNENYGFIQNGYYLFKYDTSVSSPEGTFHASQPAGENGAWIVPLEYGNGGTLYAGYSNLYRLNGDAWAQVYSFNNGPISSIRVSPVNDRRILLLFNNQLMLSNGEELMSFTSLNSSLPINAAQVQCMDFNRNNENIIYIAGTSGVYKSIDLGQSWTNITYNLNSITNSSYKSGIIHQANSINNTVYLATENAVLYLNDNSNQWTLFSDGLPHSTITDIEVNNSENHVLISTYGRGVWRSPVDSESLAVEDVNNSNNTVAVFPNPAREKIYINMSINEDADTYIYDLNGKLLKNAKIKNMTSDSSIDVSGLSSGVYLLKITSPTHLITKKFIVE